MKAALYLLLLGGIAFYAWVRPLDNFDALGYRTAAGFSGGLSQERAVFYSVKPLYVALWKAGIPPRALSVVPFIVLGFLLWLRLRSLWTLALLLLPPLVLVTRIDGPDVLSTLLVVGAIGALMARRSALAIGLLLIAVWVRPDNVILCGLAIVYLVAVEGIRWHHFALLLLAAFSYGTISHFGYPYSTFMQNSFGPGSLAAPAEWTGRLTLRQWLAWEFAGARAMAVQSELAMWALAAAAAWRWSPRWRAMLILSWAATAIHLVAFPMPDDRYFVWVYLVSGVALIEALTSRAAPQIRADEGALDHDSHAAVVSG